METVNKNYIDGIQTLDRYSRDLKRAQAQTAGYLEAMVDLAHSENVSSIWQQAKSTDDHFEAIVVGRFFEIVTHPVSHDGEGKVGCHVLVKDPATKENKELCRFMITRSGDVQAADGAQVISHLSDAGSEMLLVHISQKVLSS